ncbi:MAG: hypothetical protein ABI543_07610 [Ignavibacteria bacterium]
MEETVKKTGLISKVLIGFLILSTIITIYLMVKLIIESANFRG